MTVANVNDITPAKTMPVEAGATYVFDLGYQDFSLARGCRIVTSYLDASAQEMAELCKRRWQIEPLFCWVTQT